MCTDALEAEPDCVELIVVRARAHIALRRDLDAQADLRDIIRLDPSCGLAYRLLGELAARRDENESAAIFFREAIRLDPQDHEAHDWLAIVDVSLRPAAVARHLPAPVAAAGRFPLARGPIERGRSAADPGAAHRTLSAPARTITRPGSQPRFARGTRPPDEHDERPTKPFPRGSAKDGAQWKTPAPASRERTMDLACARTPAPRERTVDISNARTPAPVPHPWPSDISNAPALRDPTMDLATGGAATPVPLTPMPLPPPPSYPGRAKEAAPFITIPGRPATQPPAPPTKIPAPRPMARAQTPELPGFGDYLVDSGIITRDRLRAAQAYQRSMKVQLSTAIVTLGLATPQRIEWAAVAHQSQLGRDRHG